MLDIFHQDGDHARQLERLHLLDARIRKGEKPSAGKLARHFGVSTKTILRDLERLRRDFGAPLEFDESNKGWFYTEKGFSLSLQFVGKTDLQALHVLGQAVAQYENTPLGNSMTDAYRRVMSLFSAEDAVKVKRVIGRICFVQPPAIQILPEVWQAVFEALRDDQCLELAYQKASDASPAKRHFDAYGVIVRDREWYLYGYCHTRQAPLTLAFANIKSAELIDEFFELPKGFDLRKYTEAGFQGLQSDGMPDREIVLRFCPEVAESVSARPWSHRQKTIKESSGHLRISFQTSALFRVEREVLSWGDKVEVLKPVELRKRIFEIATSMAGIYE